MKKFDFNKLDKYKEAMELLGETVFRRDGYVLKVDHEQTKHRFAFIKTGEVCVMGRTFPMGEKEIYSADWKEFKKEVIEYFLNKE